VEGDPANKPTQQSFQVRVRRYESLSDILVALFASGVYWGGAKYTDVWTKALEYAWDAPSASNTWDDWVNLQDYPALLFLYAGGIASVAVGDYATLHRLLTEPRRQRYREPETPGDALSTLNTFNGDPAQSWLVGAKKGGAPVSAYLSDLLRPKFAALLPLKDRYSEAFGRWEYMYSLHRAHVGGVVPLGQFAFLEFARRGWSARRPLDEEAARMGLQWPPLKAGMFGGTQEALAQAQQLVAARMKQVDFYY
jgi:hypothetical protein